MEVNALQVYPRGAAGGDRMTTPTIQALGITQEGAPTRWKATGYVEGVGWLQAWSTSLIGAMEVAEASEVRRVWQPCRCVRHT
jgi:hypothetical protein